MAAHHTGDHCRERRHRQPHPAGHRPGVRSSADRHRDQHRQRNGTYAHLPAAAEDIGYFEYAA